MAARKNKITSDAQAVAAYGYDLSKGTHGTFLREGQTEVTPTAKAGVAANWPSISDPQRAYYSAHKHGDPMVGERKGWHWAGGTKRDRPVVHEVVPKPGSTIDQDPYTKEWRAPETGAVTSDKGLNIVDTHWIPPVSRQQREEGVIGVQGTLPHINWNQFGPRGSTEQLNWQVLR